MNVRNTQQITMTSLNKFSTITTIVVLMVCGTELSTSGSCPTVCTCSKDYKLVRCMNKKLTVVPQGIPNTTRELYLTSNLLTSLPTNAFVTLTNLNILSLKSNIITTLEDGTFNGLSKLTRLFLTQNKIQNMALSNKTFAGLKSLQRLYISQNLLTSIPDLSDMTNLIQISLDSNGIKNASFPVGFGQLKQLKSVNLAHNPLNTLKKGDLASLEKSSVSKLDLSSCGLTTVESEVFSMFTTLQSVVLSYNDKLTILSITNIIASMNSSRLSSLDLSGSVTQPLPAGIFEPLDKVPLITLKLRHTSISVVSNGSFNPLHHLIYLDMSYSKLRVIANNVFLPLKKLKTLDLSYCTLEKIPTGLPVSANKLDLSRNKFISEVPSGLFKTTSNAETLDISYCSIKQIQKSAFDGLSNLALLNISNNQLAENSIPVSSFKSTFNLSTLDLSHNKFTKIQTESSLFQGLKYLIFLDFSWNDCGYLPLNIFDPLFYLQKLDLSNNNLGNFLGSKNTGRLFQNLTNLTWLSLSGNNLEHIPNGTFSGLINLTHLQLDNNHIRMWDYGTFSPTKQLVYLNLASNSISTPTIRSVEFFLPQFHVDLSSNALNCWCDLIPFREWFDKTKVTFLYNKTYMCDSPPRMQEIKFIDFDPTSIKSKCKPPVWKYAAGGGAGALLVFSIIGCIMYRYRWSIKLRLYFLMKSCRPSNRSSNHEALVNDYLITVSYYESDTETAAWVRMFYDKMVNEWNRKEEDMFIHEINVMYGTGLGTEIGQIYDAMQSSQYIIVVLSKSYMKSGKTIFELEMAQKIAIDQGPKQKIIPIRFELEDSSLEKMAWLTQIPTSLQNDTICYESLKWKEYNVTSQELVWQKLKDLFHSDVEQSCRIQNN